MKIAGLDIGTTGCKLTVFDENGMELGKSYRDIEKCGVISDNLCTENDVYYIAKNTPQKR